MGAPNATKTTKHDSVNSDEAENAIAHWLMKSEPESRFEKGVDVKVSYMHPPLFRQIHTSVCYYKYSFLSMTIVLWNGLPADLVQVSVLDSFKSGVSQISHTLP